MWPALLIGAELVGVALPVWSLFGIDEVPTSTLVRVVVPVGAAAVVIWLVALATWLAPIRKVIALKRQGMKVPKELSVRAYTSSIRVPLRVILLRTVAVDARRGGDSAASSRRYAGWPDSRSRRARRGDRAARAS